MSSPDINQLSTMLRESSLRLDFAKNFLRELENDGMLGFDHEAALSVATRAIAQAEAEHASLLTEIERQQQAATSPAQPLSAAGQD